MKNNSHIGCVLLFIAAAFFLCFYLYKSVKTNETHQSNYRIEDMERADSILRSVRAARLAEEPEVQEMVERLSELKERLEHIKEYTDEADMLLDELEHQGVDVADIRTLMENIAGECEMN